MTGDKTISKEEFIQIVDSLHDSYTDFGRCLYAEAYEEGLVDKIYAFMKNNRNCSTDEVLMYLDDILGNPRPVVKILDTPCDEIPHNLSYATSA